MSALVFSFATATSIQIADGTWYTIQTGTLSLVMDPSFSDASGGLTTPGDQWVQWTDVGGQSYAAPYRAVVNLKVPVTVTALGPGGSGGGGG